jgi:hypothetical protein
MRQTVTNTFAPNTTRTQQAVQVCEDQFQAYLEAFQAHCDDFGAVASTWDEIEADAAGEVGRFDSSKL